MSADDLQRARRLLDSGDVNGAGAAARRAAATAQNAGDPGREALALLVLAQVELHLGHIDAAEATLLEASGRVVDAPGSELIFTEAQRELGTLYSFTDRPTEAVACLESVAEILAALGSEHAVDAALADLELGRVLGAQGDLEGAESVLLRGLGALEDLLEATDPTIGHVLLMLGELGMQREDEAKEVRPLLLRALGIFETAFGDEHPLVATVLNHLGVLTLDDGTPEDACKLIDRAVEILEAGGDDDIALGAALSSRGADAIALGTALNSRGAALRAAGRQDDARASFARAHALLSTALGDDHPHTRAVAQNLEAS